jgi:hypothetical protein
VRSSDILDDHFPEVVALALQHTIATARATMLNNFPARSLSLSSRFSLPRGLTSRGESGQKFHLQLTFISFGAEFQCFCHARLRHIAGDTQIGLMGFHQKPFC